MKKTIRLGIYASIALIPFYFFRFDLGPIPTNILEVVIGITFVFAMVNLIRGKEKPILGNIWPYLLLLAALISVFVAPDKTVALGIFKGWFVAPIALYLLIINFLNSKSLSKISLILFIQLLLVSLWAILQRYGIISPLFYQAGDASFNQYILENRAFGPFESPNFLAMYLVPIIFLSSIFLQNITNKLQKLGAILVFVLPFIALSLSGSKGGILAMAVAMLVIFAFSIPIVEKKKKLILSGFLIAGLIIVGTSLSAIDFNSGGNAIRKEIYDYAKLIVIDHPFWGIGLGNFQNTINQYSINNQNFQLWGIGYALHPHNVFLAFWLNLGLLGIVAFFAILVRLFANISQIKANQTRLFILAAIVSVIVHGLFDTTYFKNDLSAIFWLIFALTVITKNNHDEK